MTRRTHARIAGFAFLFYIAVGITLMILGSATRAAGTAARLARIAQHPWHVRVEVLLSLLICMTAVTLAVSLYAITRDEDHGLAVLGLCFRVAEGMIAALAPVLKLGLFWLATDGAATASQGPAAETLAGFLLQVGGWNATLAATLFSFGSTLFSWLLLRGRMIPVGLAWLGVVASLLLAVALPLNLADMVPSRWVQLLWLPMAAFEIPLALWLIVKGVRPLPERIGAAAAVA
jgi:hypothetical protein